jgi:hypothetical protein
METHSIQLSNLSEVSLKCESDNPESDFRAVQPPVGVPILVAWATPLQPNSTHGPANATQHERDST